MVVFLQTNWKPSDLYCVLVRGDNKLICPSLQLTSFWAEQSMVAMSPLPLLGCGEGWGAQPIPLQGEGGDWGGGGQGSARELI